MAKNTIHKVAAFVYDVYCKSQSFKEHKNIFSKMVEYHEIGKQVTTAMDKLGLYEIKNGLIIWKGNPPTSQLIEKINNLRQQIMNEHNERAKMKNENPKEDEINQYKDALEKALLKINELERNQQAIIPATEKKSIFGKLFN